MSYILTFFLLLPIFQETSEPASGSVKTIPKIEGSITIDGIPDETAWQQIDPLPLVMYQPVHEGEMTEKTEIRIGHDGEYIYISGRLYDSDPRGIRTNSLYRGRYSNDDTFAIILDTFNDHENALWFFVTPTGVRLDMQISQDGEGLGSINSDWNAFWEAETTITDEGWFAEIKIPFSTLGFQQTNDHVNMGMITYRYISRKNERHIYPNIPPNWSRGYAKPSQAKRIELNEVSYDTPIYISPYLLGGFEQLHRLNQPGNEFLLETDYVYEAGLDIKYPVFENLTLDLTLNTDFAQVEADDQQVNLSRYPLFFSEKRQFFQERAGIFNFSLGGPNRLFHSRRIGLAEGRQVRILGGARLAGRINDWEIGILNMQTDELRSINLPYENFSVVRLKRDIINENSYTGGMIAARIGLDGQYNIATGYDLLYNIIGDEYLDFKIATTFDDRFENGSNSLFRNSLIRLNWTKRTTEGFHHNTTLKRAGSQYLPEMGFESRFDYSLFNTWLRYGYFTGEDSPLRKITPTLRLFVSLRNEDGTVESMRIGQPWDFEFKSGARINARIDGWYEDIRVPLHFSDDVYVPAGDYRFFGTELSYEMSGGYTFQSEFTGSYGTFYDGSKISFEINPTWHISRYAEVSGDLQLNLLEFPDRDQTLHLNIYRFRSLLALNRHLSLQTLVQYNHQFRQVGTNLRLRYHFSEGIDFWIVYNENTNTQLSRVTPALPQFEDRILLVKYTHTFY